MAGHSFKTMAVGYIGDHRVRREQVWSTLTAECPRRGADAASREEVLRELLDDAHARIRTLEAALKRLAAAAVPDPSASADGY